MTPHRFHSSRELFPKGLRGIVFDVDGVLFDSRSSNIHYYNVVRRAVQLPPLSHEEEEYCQMSTSEQAFAYIIPKHLTADAEAARRKISYHEQVLPMLVPEPGLLEALHWLHNWRVHLGIYTNRTNSVDVLLRYFSLETFFSLVKTAENSAPKPHPQGLLEILSEWDLPNNQMLFIGDSRVDEQAANAAGVPFCAFRSKDLQATVHISDYFELIHWLTPLIEHSPQRETPLE